MSHRVSGSRLVRLVVVAVMLSSPAIARGDAITEVTLTRSGPDQNLPLGSAFYLKGEIATEVVAVTPLFVRYSRKPWGIAPGYDCGDIQVAVTKLAEKSPLFDVKSGRTDVKAIWMRPEKGRGVEIFDAIAGDPVLIAGTWTRGDAEKDAKQFKVLVADPKFFVTGARYCMFVYQKTAKRVTKEVRALLDAFSEKIEACSEKNEENKVTRDQCIAEKFEATKTEIKKLTKKIPDEWLDKDAKKAAVDLADNRAEMKTYGTELGALVKANIKLPGEATPMYAPVATDRLAQVLVRVLAREGTLLPVVAGGLEFYDDSGTIPVRHLGILDNDTGVRIAADPAVKTKTTRKSITLKLDTIALPDSKLTVLDLLMLARRKIRVGKTYVAVDKLFPEVIAPALRDGDAGAATLDDVVATMTAWNDLLKSLAAPGRELQTVLNTWLTSDVFEACATVAGTRAPTACGAGGVVGFAADQNPFEGLRAKLTDRKNLTALYKPLETSAISELPVAFSERPLATQVQMTQKVFFTTYVTPFVGIAELPQTEDDLTFKYGGVQVFLWPNPIDEPMWTNGFDDLRRLFAFEIGFAPKLERFGPGKRYGPVSDAIPPFMFGVALQILPYVTVSGGRAWVGATETSLPQERPDTIGSWYVSVAVQANVPDLVRALSGSSTSTGK